MAERSAATLDGALGFELIEAGEELARGRFAVTDRVRQPMGVVHGGAYAAMAETLASATTYMHVAGDGNIAVGQSNHTSFLRPVAGGTVAVIASSVPRARISRATPAD